MPEVVFGDSAAGSMASAMGRTGPLGGASGAVLYVNGGKKPSPRELERVRRELKEREERERREWQDAVPLEGRREDVISLSLLLSTGDIREAGIGPARASLLRQLYSDLSEEDVERILEKSRQGLAAVLERAGQGEPLRVWSGPNPDDACGACWLMEQLRPLGFEHLDVTLVRLRPFRTRADGVVVRYAGWGEVEPHQWGRAAQTGEKLPPGVLRMMANRWRQLQEENAPLRIVLNGRLVSAPETLYDFYILREIEAREREFHEARVIGDVIGKNQLGIGDGWIAHRIEAFIREGLLEPVTEPKPGEPSYRRMLRRRDVH